MEPWMFPRLFLKGSAYEMGRQHGSAFRSLIRDNVDLYFALFSHYAHLGREEVISRARSFVPPIEGFDGEVLEEMRGIADGSESLLEEIVALNARTEIMLESRLTVEDVGRKLFPDTILRYCRSGKLLEKERGRIALETFQRVLQDHFNYPSAICRHPDGRLPELEQIQTNASLVMDLTDGVMFLCPGNPCAGAYVPLTFAG